MCNDFRAKRTFFINFFRKNFGGIKKSSNFALANEISHLQNQNGALVQLVRMPACHAGGRWFESCTHRKTRKQSRSRVFCFYPTDLPYQWKFRLSGKFLGINYALLPNRQWNQKQKHKKQPWSNVECFAFGGATVRFASLETSFHAANHTIPPPPSYEGSPHCPKDKNRSPFHGEKPLMIK